MSTGIKTILKISLKDFRFGIGFSRKDQKRKEQSL